MAITQFSFGSVNDKLTAVQLLERGAKLNSRPVDGTPCQFRTGYDVQLVPIEVQSAALESNSPKDGRGKYVDSHIRLSLRCFGDANFHEFKVGKTAERLKYLRFFLNGDPQLIFPLYEIILNQATHVEFRPREAPIGDKSLKTLTNIQLKLPDPVIIPASEAIRQVGFEEHQSLLPYSKRSFQGYRLLTEYFAFPYKFLFFDVCGLEEAIARKFGSHFDILIHLKDVEPPKAPVTAETFKLGCTPIVNLFNRMADPIYLSQQKYEYHVVPDVHRQMTTEIYSIDDVITTDPKTNTTREFSSFYSLRHAYGEQMEKSFWYASRRDSQRDDDEGTEMFISMVDMNFNPNVPAVEVLNVRAMCTNRDLPARLPFGGLEGDLEVEGSGLLSKARCLTKPTETLRPARRRALQWRLISHLNLNYLSIVEGQNGVPEALQEILHLYNFSDSSATRKQILGITGIDSKRVVRRIGDHIGAGFVRGLETTVTMDETEFVGSGMFLFACVLERFLGLYSSLNSFNQMVLRTKQREQTVRVFPPRTGDQTLL